MNDLKGISSFHNCHGFVGNRLHHLCAEGTVVLVGCFATYGVGMWVFFFIASLVGSHLDKLRCIYIYIKDTKKMHEYNEHIDIYRLTGKGKNLSCDIRGLLRCKSMHENKWNGMDMPTHHDKGTLEIPLLFLPQ